jgi:hypothetical protein
MISYGPDARIAADVCAEHNFAGCAQFICSRMKLAFTRQIRAAAQSKVTVVRIAAAADYSQLLLLSSKLRGPMGNDVLN